MTSNGNRTLELSQQDWELIRGAVMREIARWPKGHVYYFRYMALHKVVSNCCVQHSSYKTVRRVKQ